MSLKTQPYFAVPAETARVARASSECKKRFEEAGLEGLRDRPPIVKSHPFTTSEETVERIVTLSLENPSRGCNFISDRLRQEGTLVSYPTVQNILNKQGLRRSYC